MAEALTPNQIISGKIDALQEVDPFFADMFATAVDMFPSFRDRFVGVEFQFKQESGFAYYGDYTQQHSLIEIGSQEKGIGYTKWLPARLSLRHGIDEALLQDAEVGPSVVRLVSFPHELGHMLQDDVRQMKRYFGGAIPYSDYPEHSVSMFDADMSSYVECYNRTDELNADYIGTCILANTAIGGALGVKLPEYAPSDWYKWAAQKVLTHKQLAHLA